MKKIFSLLFVCCFCLTTFAQMNKVITASNNLNYYRDEGKLDYLISAQEAVDAAINHEKSKANAKTWYYRALVYYELASQKESPELAVGALDKAYEAYQKTAEFDAKGKYKKEIANGMAFMGNAIYMEGSAAYKAGDYANAYESFKKVMDINEASLKTSKDAVLDTSTMLAAAFSADKAGNTEAAKGLYTKLLDLDYKDAAVYQSVAALYKTEGNLDKAREYLSKGREAFPDNKALIIDELNILLGEGNQDEAIGKMEEAIALDPENATLHFAMGAAYDAQKKYDEAIVSYQKAIDLKSDYYDAYYNLGAVYYNQAADKTKEMNELDISDQKNYDRLKGESDGLFGKALPFFESALELRTEDLNTLIALKEIYARQGNNDKYTAVSDKIKALQGN